MEVGQLGPEHDLPLEGNHRAGHEITNGNPEVYKGLYSRRDDALGSAELVAEIELLQYQNVGAAGPRAHATRFEAPPAAQMRVKCELRPVRLRHRDAE